MRGLYVEENHPLTGDVVWKFQCSGIEALKTLKCFLDKYPHPGYRLSVFDILSDISTLSGISCIEISDVPFEDIVQIVEFIYHQEQAEPIFWVGVNSWSDSYIVAMPLTRGRICGRYKVVDKKLVAL